MARVTQADLARELGLSTMTVSLALRRHQRISPTTRQRVQQLAALRGFIPDPILSELGRQRWKRADPAFHGTVAVLIPQEAAGRDPVLFEGKLTAAVKTRLQQLGYSLDLFGVDTNANPRRLARVLRHRGIVGILHTRLPGGMWLRQFPWNHFISVALNYGHSAPPLHAVVLERFPNWIELWQRLHQRGYRRPAWVCFDEPDAADFLQNEAGRYYASRTVFGADPAPSLTLDPNTDIAGREAEQSIREWWLRESPDCLVALNEYVYDIAIRALPRGAVRGGCCLCLTGALGRWSGFVEDVTRTAEVAVDILHSRLRLGKLGENEAPLLITIPRPWHEGQTLPDLRANRPGLRPPRCGNATRQG